MKLTTLGTTLTDRPETARRDHVPNLDLDDVGSLIDEFYAARRENDRLTASLKQSGLGAIINDA